MLRTTIALVLCLIVLSPLASAGELLGVSMPDSVNVAGKELKLNGLGPRRAMLGIRVYVAGLYVENPTKDAEAILNSPGVKRLEMKFLRDVDKGKQVEAWTESEKKNCAQTPCKGLEQSYQQLKSYMADMGKGDSMAYTFYPDRVEVEVKGEKKPPIKAEGFSKSVLTTWLGKEPPNKELKEGLLGAPQG